MERSGGEALAAQLVAEGVSAVFGVPGVQLDHAVEGLYRERDHIRFYGPRHEQAATYMADGYARVTGRPGVAMVVPGPGVLNAAAGLATAYACSSPVLLIAGQIPSHQIGKGLGLLHEIPNQAEVLAGLTKWSARAARPAEIPALVRHAFTMLRSGRPQPVALEIPPDVLAQREAVKLEAVPPAEADGVRTGPAAADLAHAARLLSRAARPLIYAGSGVLASGAAAALERVASRLQAPVVVSDNGRGALSDRHPLALTTLAGRSVLPDADVVLAVGAKFVVAAGQLAAGARTLVINADPREAARSRDAAVVMVADAREALDALARELGPNAKARCWANLDAARADAARQVAAVEPQAAFVSALRRAIPDDGVLVSELTQVGYAARVGYPVYEPRTFMTPGYQGTLGYGFPTALGAKIGAPQRAVVSITGDGGFGWAMAELATARRYAVGLVTVVFNDCAFGNVKRTQQQEFSGHVLGTELVNPDYVALAEAFGIAGVRVDGPEALTEAIGSALRAGSPTLIEVPVGEMASPWPLLMRRTAVPAAR